MGGGGAFVYGARQVRSTVPRGFGCTCGTATYDLQSAYIFCFIIRKLRLAFVVYSGFTRGEYRIALVDFIVALRRTKGRRRRTLRSPSPPSSGLHLLTPGNPLRRGILAAAVYTNLGSCIQVQVAYPQFRILCSYLCSGLDRSRFSRVAQLVSHVFHYWGDRSFVPAATVGFAMVFRRICADRGWVDCFCG